jgi:predicted small secreted protein
MKKLLFALLLACVITLSGCSSPTISENGHDLSELEQCIDDMVDQMSSSACDLTERKQLAKDYIQSFESEFDTTGSNYNMSDLEFTTNKSGDESRVTLWFQYSLLSETEIGNYEVFKEIIQTMLIDMRTMNDGPEMLISGEFLFEGHLIYKFSVDANDDLSGTIIVSDILTPFATVFDTYESNIQTYGTDSELISQKFTIIGSDHSVELIVDIAANTYTMNIYRSDNEDTSTVAEIETLIETSLSEISLTLIE